MADSGHSRKPFLPDELGSRGWRRVWRRAKGLLLRAGPSATGLEPKRIVRFHGLLETLEIALEIRGAVPMLGQHQGEQLLVHGRDLEDREGFCEPGAISLRPKLERPFRGVRQKQGGQRAPDESFA